MSQSEVTSFYGLRKNIRRECAKNIDDKNIKSQNVSTFSKDKKLVKNECKRKVKIHEPHINAQKTSKPVSKATKPSSKRVLKAEKLELSQPKVTGFYESTKCGDNEENTSRDSNFSFVSEKIVPVSKVLCPEIVVKVENCEESSKPQNANFNSFSQSPKEYLVDTHKDTPKKNKLLNVHVKNYNLQCFPKKLNLESKDVFKFSGTTKQDKFSSELKSVIASFQERTAKIKNYESNPFKSTSMITPAKDIDKKSPLPNVPAYQRYQYLADPNMSSLILPYQYKKLNEIYQSLDIVVSNLHNKKEKITLDKVQEGVQKIMKRNFSKTDLGQIVKIVPSAFGIKLKKCNFRNANEPTYELVLSPNVRSSENCHKASKSSKFVTITSQDLLNRKKEFYENLLQRVHNYHQIFLSRLHIPPVTIDSIKRWHPKFLLDSIPNIEAATLPENESMGVNKFLQNKRKDLKTFREVAENSPSNKNTEVLTTDLKSMCQELIAKIQAFESSMLLECAQPYSDQVQRKAMLERLPKIMHILWHYFVAQRKSAVDVDTAVGKIFHSFSSLSSHEEAKMQLSLIAEVFPGWLSFVQIPKGLYITMNKNKNLNEMLKHFNCE